VDTISPVTAAINFAQTSSLTGFTGVKNLFTPISLNTSEDAYLAASIVLSGKTSNPVSGATADPASQISMQSTRNFAALSLPNYQIDSTNYAFNSKIAQT
jgi:hypothetical protein